ncbi:hypothetical protein RB623_21150 [Mesorhizobium sp. LHD-90]|uniref:hypothetical protein n=1 Tax=Mesorhizobium sp. LHD-90 TaxID=3071414 RepID=UPI0027E034AB|nr:hypothetical protein [Mesorhizobium sp. LHD-90]MDQ6436566.1 hypothetical protein [Mesorhizobium sp. LHD-90]
MDKQINPLATQHLPPFVTAPGETDILFNVMVVILVVMILLLGAFYFRLHALPERMAHRANRTQIEIIGVLALISLFTHNHLFWIAGLLLAMVQFPDFRTPMVSIADSLNRIAGRYDQPTATQAIPIPSEPEDQPISQALPQSVANVPVTKA